MVYLKLGDFLKMTSTKLQSVKEYVTTFFKNLECSICLELLKDPLSTNCHHDFCRICIQTVFKKRYKTLCPLCKTSITRRGLYTNVKLVEIVNIVKELYESMKMDAGCEVTPPRSHHNVVSSSYKLERDTEIFGVSPIKNSATHSKRTGRGRKRKIDVYEDAGSSVVQNTTVSSNINVSSGFSISRRPHSTSKRKYLTSDGCQKSDESNKWNEKLAKHILSPSLQKKSEHSSKKRRPTEDKLPSCPNSADDTSETSNDNAEEFLDTNEQTFFDEIPSTWIPEVKKEHGSRDYSKSNCEIVKNCLLKRKKECFPDVEKTVEDRLAQTHSEITKEAKVVIERKIFKSRNNSVINHQIGLKNNKHKTVDEYTFFPSQRTAEKCKKKRLRNKKVAATKDSTFVKHLDLLSMKFKEKCGIPRRHNDMVLSSSELCGIQPSNKENGKKSQPQTTLAEIDPDFTATKKPLQQIQEDSLTTNLFCTPSVELVNAFTKDLAEKQVISAVPPVSKKRSRTKSEVLEKSRSKETLPSTQDKIAQLARKIENAELFELNICHKRTQSEKVSTADLQSIVSSIPKQTKNLETSFSGNSDDEEANTKTCLPCTESEVRKTADGINRSNTSKTILSSDLRESNEVLQNKNTPNETKVVSPTVKSKLSGLKRGKLSRQNKESDITNLDKFVEGDHNEQSANIHKECESVNQKDIVESKDNSEERKGLELSGTSVDNEEVLLNQIGEGDSETDSDSESEPIPFIYVNRSAKNYAESESSQISNKETVSDQCVDRNSDIADGETIDDCHLKDINCDDNVNHNDVDLNKSQTRSDEKTVSLKNEKTVFVDVIPSSCATEQPSIIGGIAIPPLLRADSPFRADVTSSKFSQSENLPDGVDFDIDNFEKYIQRSDRKTFALNSTTLELEELGQKASTMDIIEEMCGNFEKSSSKTGQVDSKCVERLTDEKCIEDECISGKEQCSEEHLKEKDTDNNKCAKFNGLRKDVICDGSLSSSGKVSTQLSETNKVKNICNETAAVNIHKPINENLSKVDSSSEHNDDDNKEFWDMDIPSLLTSLHSEESLESGKLNDIVTTQPSQTHEEYFLSAVKKCILCPGCSCSLDARLPSIKIVFNKATGSCTLKIKEMTLVLNEKIEEVKVDSTCLSSYSFCSELSSTTSLVADDDGKVNTPMDENEFQSIPHSKRNINHDGIISCSKSDNLTNTQVQNLLENSQMSLSDVNEADAGDTDNMMDIGSSFDLKDEGYQTTHEATERQIDFCADELGDCPTRNNKCKPNEDTADTTKKECTNFEDDNFFDCLGACATKNNTKQDCDTENLLNVGSSFEVVKDEGYQTKPEAAEQQIDFCTDELGDCPTKSYKCKPNEATAETPKKECTNLEDDDFFDCLGAPTLKQKSDEGDNSDGNVSMCISDSDDSLSSTDSFLNACTQKVQRQSEESDGERAERSKSNSQKRIDNVDEEKMAELLNFNCVDKDDPDFKFADSLLAPLEVLALKEQSKTLTGEKSKKEILKSPRKKSTNCSVIDSKPLRFKRIKRLSSSSNSSVECHFSRVQEDPIELSSKRRKIIEDVRDTERKGSLNEDKELDSSEAMGKVLANIEKDLNCSFDKETKPSEDRNDGEGMKAELNDDWNSTEDFDVSQTAAKKFVEEGPTASIALSSLSMPHNTQDKQKIRMEIEHLKKVIQQMESQIVKLPDYPGTGENTTTPKWKEISTDSDDEMFSQPIPPTPPRNKKSSSAN